MKRAAVLSALLAPATVARAQEAVAPIRPEATLWEVVLSGGPVMIPLGILSVIAVAGGGAAWKFYSQSSSQKHELEMARLEKGQNSHAACDAKHLEMLGRVDALERKFAGAIDLDAPSTTDLEKKIKNLERRLREIKTPRKA